MSKYSVKCAERQKAVSAAGGGGEIVVPTRNATSAQFVGSDHFCAGILFDKRDGVWCIAGVTDKRYPTQVRIPGGTNKFAAQETRFQTLCREIGEELLVTLDPTQTHDPIHSLPKGRGHMQYFFVVKNENLKKGDEVRVGVWFPDRDGEMLIANWWTLSKFCQSCGLPNHLTAFLKAVEATARNSADRTFREQAEAARLIVP